MEDVYSMPWMNSSYHIKVLETKKLIRNQGKKQISKFITSYPKNTAAFSFYPYFRWYVWEIHRSAVQKTFREQQLSSLNYM